MRARSVLTSIVLGVVVLMLFQALPLEAGRKCQACKSHTWGEETCSYCESTSGIGWTFCWTEGSCPQQCGHELGCIGGGNPDHIVIVFPGVWRIAQGGSYGSLPAVYSLASFTLDNIRTKIADNTGASEANIDFKFGAFADASDADFPTHGYLAATNNGFSWSSVTSDDTQTYRVCEHTGSGENLVASEGVESGEVLLAKVTIDTVDYVISLYVEEYTDSEWESDADTIQEAYWTDMDGEFEGALNLSGFAPQNECE